MNGITKVCNPYKENYPQNTADDYFARSIWDMRIYNDAIYLGCGDLWNNRGPVVVKSFSNMDSEILLEEELIIDEEMLSIFRIYENTLFIPGIDPTQHKEQKVFGNYYFKKSGVWKKQNTIPYATHVYDLALFNNMIFISYSVGSQLTTKKSLDNGKTWENIVPGSTTQPYGMALIPLKNQLLFLGYDFYQVYKNGEFQTFPLKEIIITSSNRVESFGNGILSSPVALYTLGLNEPNLNEQIPLFFLEDFQKGPSPIHEFNKKGIYVRDLVIKGKYCYILYVVNNSNNNYKTGIKRSQNLYDWEKITEFKVPALPYSFEILNNEIYIGLGNGWYDINRPEAGTIWKVD
jgi:hypothetical protein